MTTGSLARPRALRPGDKVAVLRISSPVDPAHLEPGLDVLRFAGLDPVVYPSALDPGSMRPYLAGDDKMRAGDLRTALLDPSIAGITFAKGGSGSQRTLEAMVRLGAAPGRVAAVIGPAVCGRCYEVPAALRDEVAALLPGSGAITRQGTPALDLPAGAERVLRRAGVASLHRVEVCTIEDESFFSHRGSAGLPTGRHAGVVMLDP